MTVTVRRYVCALCGTRLPADRMVRSRFTGARYCRDLAACRKRRKGKGQ